MPFDKFFHAFAKKGLPENREREIRGLMAAMDFFETNNGLIVSFNQHDTFIHNGKQIHVLPAHEFMEHLQADV